MPTATVTVTDRRPVQGEAKTGLVKGSDGVEYRLYPAQLSSVREGGTYEFIYKKNEFKGKTYNIVDEVKAINGAAYPGPAIGVGQRDTQRHILVCGILNNAVHGQGLEALADRDKIRQAIDNCTRAYDQSLLSNPQKRPDLDEEIPV